MRAEDDLREVQAALAELFGDELLDGDALTAQTSLLYDLGLESIEYVALFELLQTRFGLDLGRSELAQLDRSRLATLTVGDLAHLIKGARDA